MNWKNKLAIIFLLLLILIDILFYFLIHPQYFISDDKVYIESAIDLFKGTYQFRPNTFSQRFGVFAPAGLFIKIFGINEFSATLWPLLIFLLTVIVVFFILKKNANIQTAMIGSFITALCPLHILQSIELTNDITVSFFVLCGLYILYRIRTDKTKNIIYAACFVFSLFFAFITKLTVVYLMPFLLFIFIYDLIKKENLKFWFYSFGIGIVLLLLYFTFYQIQTGNFLYRFIVSDKIHNTSPVYSYWGKFNLIVQRLLFLPFLTIVNNIYYFIVIVFSMPFIYSIFINKKGLNDFYTFWAIYALFILLSYWFMPISLKHLNWLDHNQDRHWLLLMAPFTILSANNIYRLIKAEIDRRLIIEFIFYIAMFAFAIFITCYMHSYKKIVLFSGFIAFFISLILLKSLNSKFFGLYKILCILVLLIFASSMKIYFSQKIFTTEQHNEVFKNYFINDIRNNILVITDRRNIEGAPFFLRYKEYNNLSFVDWANINEMRNIKFDKIYFFKDKHIVDFISQYSNYYIPKFYFNAPLSWEIIYYKKEITLYMVKGINELKEYY